MPGISPCSPGACRFSHFLTFYQIEPQSPVRKYRSIQSTCNRRCESINYFGAKQDIWRDDAAGNRSGGTVEAAPESQSIPASIGESDQEIPFANQIGRGARRAVSRAMASRSNPSGQVLTNLIGTDPNQMRWDGSHEVPFIFAFKTADIPQQRGGRGIFWQGTRQHWRHRQFGMIS